MPELDWKPGPNTHIYPIDPAGEKCPGGIWAHDLRAYFDGDGHLWFHCTTCLVTVDALGEIARYPALLFSQGIFSEEAPHADA